MVIAVRRTVVDEPVDCGSTPDDTCRETVWRGEGFMQVFSMARGMGALGVVAAISACAHLPTAGSGRDPSTDEYVAAYQIAAARCDRQTPSCESRVGVHYATRDACIAAKLRPSVEEADLKYCAYYPLHDSALNECVSAIRSKECGTGVAVLVACRGKTLCPFASEEGTI